MISENALLEWAQVYGNRYGVPRAQVKETLARGESVIVGTDVQGVDNIRRVEPGALTIFVAPPSPEALEARLRSRGGIEEPTIQLRLAEARLEMERADSFDYTIVNHDGGLEAAIDRMVEIIELESRQTDRPTPSV